MKLLLSVFPSFAVGGAQSRFTMLANHLGQDWRHAIIAMDAEITARERLSGDLNVSFPKVEVRKGDLVGNVRRFRRLITSLGPTTMLTHNFGSIEWALANRLSSTHHVHVEDGFGPEERHRQLPRRVWLRRVALHNRPVILPSQTLLDIAAGAWRLKSKQLHYIPNGIDLSRFLNGGPRFTWPDDKASDGPIIGTVAALRAEKNVGRLIRAFHCVATQTAARLLIIGDGPERGDLTDLVHNLGLSSRVVLCGHVPKPDDLIRSLDIFAMSSDTEQMPISLIEAMAAGLPTASTNVGDIARMVPLDGHPFLTPCDHVALGEALLSLVLSPELRQKLGSASQKKARDSFDQSKMFLQWSKLLEKSNS